MQEDECILEKKSREFLDLMLGKDNCKTAFNPFKLDNFQEYVSQINYMHRKRYIEEVGESVKTLHYKLTSEEREWRFK